MRWNREQDKYEIWTYRMGKERERAGMDGMEDIRVVGCCGDGTDWGLLGEWGGTGLEWVREVCGRGMGQAGDAGVFSVWRSSYKIRERLRPDQTKTDKDWKFSGLMKTVTAVRSSVLYHFGK